MLIQSWCSISLSGLPLLDPAEQIVDEITPMARTTTYQPRDLFRAAYKDTIGRALVEHTFSFTRSVRFPSGAAARHFALGHAAALPTTPGSCVIAAAVGGGVWVLDRARLTGYAPRTYAQTFTATYTITGGEYSVLVAPTDPAANEGYEYGPSGGGVPVDHTIESPSGGTGNLVTEDGDNLTTEDGDHLILD